MWVSWILLIIVLAVPLLSLVMSLAASATMKFKADCPAAIRLGDEIHLNVTTSGIASYFSFCKVRMTVTDYMAGKTVKKVFMIHDRGTSQIPVDTSHCGAYSYRLTWLYIYDLFGLFFVKINLNMNNEILVKPVPAMPSVMPDMFGFKAKNLRRSKLPNSEIYDIREYQIGDPLRSIHWKMSASRQVTAGRIRRTFARSAQDERRQGRDGSASGTDRFHVEILYRARDFAQDQGHSA